MGDGTSGETFTLARGVLQGPSITIRDPCRAHRSGYTLVSSAFPYDTFALRERFPAHACVVMLHATCDERSRGCVNNCERLMRSTRAQSRERTSLGRSRSRGALCLSFSPLPSVSLSFLLSLFLFLDLSIDFYVSVHVLNQIDEILFDITSYIERLRLHRKILYY